MARREFIRPTSAPANTAVAVGSRITGYSPGSRGRVVRDAIAFSTAILTEATLSYLGLGTQPPRPSWGTMLNAGRQVLLLAPWSSIFPGLAIALTVLGFNLLGDGLRDALDPRLR